MNKDRDKQVSLWLPEGVLERIRDDAERLGITHLHGGQELPSVAPWILQAIDEKLQRVPGQ